MPISDFYPEGTELRAQDNELRTLHKIAALTAAVGSGTVGTLIGAGAPGAGLGVSSNTYFDTTNRDFYVKNGATWELLVDLV